MGLDRGAGMPVERGLQSQVYSLEAEQAYAPLGDAEGIEGAWADIRGYVVDTFDTPAVAGVYRSLDTFDTGAWFAGLCRWELEGDGAFSLGTGVLSYTLGAGAGVARLNEDPDGNEVVDEEDDDDDEVSGDGPWSVEGGVRIALRFRALGATGVGGALRLRWDDGSGWVSATVFLPDGATGPKLLVRGDGGEDESDIVPSPDPEAWYCVWLDTRNPGWLVGRAWEERDADVKWSGEWTDLAAIDLDELVEVDEETEGAPDGSLELRFSGPGVTAWEVSDITAYGPAASGQIVYDYLGQGDGVREQFRTAMPYRYGSLASFFVTGVECRAREVDRNTGTFRVVDSIAPRQGMRLTVTYVADFDNDDGTDDPTADDTADDLV
jgi:hypothetical protein